MGAVLGDLAALGYDAEWESIPAAAVGAPHLRYRVWIVAYARQAGRRIGDGRGQQLAQGGQGSQMWPTRGQGWHSSGDGGAVNGSRQVAVQRGSPPLGAPPTCGGDDQREAAMLTRRVHTSMAPRA